MYKTYMRKSDFYKIGITVKLALILRGNVCYKSGVVC